MVDSTDICGIPYPELSDAPEIPVHIENFVTAVDTLAIAKFVDESTRDAAITSPVEGQHCFLTTNESFYVYRTVEGWTRYVNSIIKTKTAHETLGNSTTLQDDNHLTGYVLKGDTLYSIRGMIMHQGPDEANCKFFLNFSTGDPGTGAGYWGMAYSQSNPGAIGWTAANFANDFRIGNNDAPEIGFLTIRGVIQTPVTPPIVGLQWAKNASNASTTTIWAGSYLEFLELS